MRLLLDTHVFLWFIPFTEILFDRMLICQALEHGLTLVTVDETVASYPVSVFR